MQAYYVKDVMIQLGSAHEMVEQYTPQIITPFLCRVWHPTPCHCISAYWWSCRWPTPIHTPFCPVVPEWPEIPEPGPLKEQLLKAIDEIVVQEKRFAEPILPKTEAEREALEAKLGEALREVQKLKGKLGG
jgi:hypothetical protein